MKRFLILLTLPILACGGFAESVSLTVTPIASTAPALDPASTAGSAPENASTPSPTEDASVPVVQNPNAQTFPDPNQYQWQPIASGLNRPVDIQPAAGKLFIVEKYGAIRIFEKGQLLNESFLNIDDRVDDGSNEMGLLGMAFHPDFASNGYFYINYTGDQGNTRISRFTANGNTADPNSEVVLMIVEQPYPNHNGGGLAFGPDGYLYIALGDGGLAGDPHKNGQNTNSLLGKILRIDVNNGVPYLIPADNPFENEVWAYGLRNPWRISFDRASGDLWIGDVGQGDWEEIDYLPAGSSGGANFGWSIMEGSYGYNGSLQQGLLLPATEYDHNESGCSVTGGYVYRGAMPEWSGIYIYGDYCLGRIWGLLLKDGQWQNQTLFETGTTITTFGQDANGELYFASDQGTVYRLGK